MGEWQWSTERRLSVSLARGLQTALPSCLHIHLPVTLLVTAEARPPQLPEDLQAPVQASFLACLPLAGAASAQ